ncbi:NADase-type glycan-binding domain-containing protein, partial [Streptomyces cinereospinus]
PAPASPGAGSDDVPPRPSSPHPAPDDIRAEPTPAEPPSLTSPDDTPPEPPSATAPAASPSSAPPAPAPAAPRDPVTPRTPNDIRDAPGPRLPGAPAPEPREPDPVAVRPAKPVAPRPVVRPVAVPDDGAGVPCPACGTPNQPGRRFCRRCAAVLNPTASPDPLPWWRTVWPFRRRVRASSGRAWRFLVILAVVLALCAAGFLLLPAGRALLEDTRDKLGKPKPVTPVGVEASAEVPGHPVGNTLDGLNNRYWGAPAPGASVTYTFRRPFRLFDLIVTNGPSAGPQEYPRQARALQLDLEVTAEDGTRQRRELTLGDRPGPQTIPLGISDVTTVRLVLRAPAGLSPGRHLALAEVEFFQRS